MKISSYSKKNELGIDSEIALFDEGDGINVILIKDGVTYHYLLKISIAKEVREDWVNSLKSKPSDGEIAKRLFEYAVNDA